MGGCFGGKKQSENLKLAQRLFDTIDSKRTGVLNADNLAAYFREYTESSVRLVLQEIDFNRDGQITCNEWLGYWEYLRLAGCEEKSIRKSLTHLQQGVAYFNFSQASAYRSDVSRQTLLGEIIGQMRRDPELPVVLEP